MNQSPQTTLLAYADLIALIDELHALVSDENHQLELGLPASIAQSVRRKMQLGVELENWLIVMRAGQMQTDAAQTTGLVERLTALKTVMRDNTRLLRRAFGASRRRVEAIMTQLRNSRSRPAGYGADSRQVKRLANSQGARLA